MGSPSPAVSLSSHSQIKVCPLGWQLYPLAGPSSVLWTILICFCLGPHPAMLSHDLFPALYSGTNPGGNLGVPGTEPSSAVPKTVFLPDVPSLRA